ncbi:MAG: hypothetical protein O9293_11075 [Porphyrobacter sp.]|nr:hypothetical protein [Porphyrobacter sp.]
MTFPRRLQIFGVALVFAAFLTSPLKPYVFRCGMKPVDLLEGPCTAFKEWHSPIGFIPLALCVVAIAASVVLKNRESNK